MFPFKNIRCFEPADNGATVVGTYFVPSLVHIAHFAAGAGIDIIGSKGGQVTLDNCAVFFGLFIEIRHGAGKHAERKN